MRVRDLLLLSACIAAPVCAQQPGEEAPRARHNERISAIFTISGGISLGSYQAGVNWALLEMFKLTASDSIRRAWNLPQYELKAVTGASAGNINGFLSAIEWCRTREPIAAESSIFWKTWIRAGFDQLFPLHRYNLDVPAEALLSRRYFRVALFDTVRVLMQDLPEAESLHGCSMPVGVTVTRIMPGRVEISNDFEAVTQRYASVVTLSRRNQDTLVFLSPPNSIRRTKKLGALFFLPADQQDVIAIHDVFSLIQASSAFPGAFAPVELKYLDPNKRGCTGDASVQCSDSALFADGGVFDNNPIDLAAGIYNAAVWENESSADSNAIMIYIDPEAVRGNLAIGREEKAMPPARRGIDVLIQLFAGAVPSARQYELQSFARLLERAPQVFVRENIKVTDRVLPVVSEQLGAFAGFLGKPFREADFYVGIYDALNFFASEACPSRTGVDSACVKTRLGEFVQTPLLTFGGAASVDAANEFDLGRKVARALYQWEYVDADSDSVFQFNPTAPDREILVFALLRANSRLANGFNSEACTEEKDPIKALLCLGGFRLMLEDFANDTVRRVIDRALAQRPNECTPEDWLLAADRCVVDESFRAFIRDPERFMARTIGLFLHQLWRVERSLKESDLHNWAGVTSLSEITYQSTIGYRYRRGLDLNTSSIPRGTGLAWLAAIVPNYISTNIGSAGYEFGYRPTFHVSNSLALALNGVPLHVINAAADELDTFRWSVGPRIHWKPAWSVVLVSGLETGVDMFGRWRRSPFGDEADRVWSMPVTAYLVGNKFRLGVQFLPDNDSAVHGGSWWSVSIGVADVNGLVYWMLRPFF